MTAVNADVALTSLGLTWHKQRRESRVGVCDGVGRRVEAHACVARAPKAFGGACDFEFSRFWWLRTNLDEIYPMELSVRRTETRR
jgi:hypothetical protein